MLVKNVVSTYDFFLKNRDHFIAIGKGVPAKFPDLIIV